MLSDFSEANLKKIVDCSEHFLLQCTKTKVLHRMGIVLYHPEDASTPLYYPVKKIPLGGGTVSIYS